MGGGGLLQPPFSDFPSYHFYVFAKIAIRSIYPPFVQIPMYQWKNVSKIFAVENVGGGGGGGCNNPPPPPEREGVAAKINFRSFHFLSFFFCHNNDYVPEILET